MKVELRPHISTVYTKKGPVERDEHQSKVFIDGKLYGYVSNTPGSDIRLIVSGLNDHEVNEIKSKVDELRNSVSGNVHQIPNIEESTYTVVLEEQVTSSEIGF